MSALLKKLIHLSLLTSLLAGLSACTPPATANMADYAYVPQKAIIAEDPTIADF